MAVPYPRSSVLASHRRASGSILVTLCYIHGGWSGNTAGYSQSAFSFPLLIIIPPLLYTQTQSPLRHIAAPTRQHIIISAAICWSLHLQPSTWLVITEWGYQLAIFSLIDNVKNMNIARQQQFGKHRLKVRIVTNRSRSPFARQRFSKHHLKARIVEPEWKVHC